jgi:serine/threonine protein kinase
MNSIDFLHTNNIIHSDYKLENIIVNYDENYDITDLKIIDFDVGLFNTIPENLKKTTENYQKNSLPNKSGLDFFKRLSSKNLKFCFKKSWLCVRSSRK